MQRLRAQTAGIHQERPLNRPKKQRNPEDDEEDEPVYVLDDNSTLTAKEFEALKDKSSTEKGEDEKQEGLPIASDEKSEDKGDLNKDDKSRNSVLEIGGKAQKRKIGKIVGAEASDDEPAEKKNKAAGTGETPKKKKPKSKQKVKLSFGDD